LGAAFLSGALCCSATPEPKSIEGLLARPEKPVLPLSGRVLLLGDTQTQTTFGRSFYERSSLADQVIGSSMRSPIVDEFADAILLQACAGAGPSGPVIHLGDAANTSCDDELEHAFEVMDRCRNASQWAFVPGNHEGFLMGNTDDLCDGREWKVACDGSNPLTKAGVVERLQQRLLASGWAPEGKWNDRVEEVFAGTPLCERGAKWWRGVGTGGIVVEAASCTDSREDHRFMSFFAQLVRLPPPVRPAGATSPPQTYAILLDTAQYETRPALLPIDTNAGTVGSVLDNQWRVVEAWLDQHATEPIVIIGHHRVQELVDASRQRLLKIAGERSNVVLYVSGHTHSEAFYQHELPGGTGAALVEMNVASLIDYPNSYRDLQLMFDGDNVLLSTTGSPSSLERSENVPRCEPGWLPEDGEFFPREVAPNLGDKELDLAVLRLRASILKRLFERVGIVDARRGREVVKQLGAALSAGGEDPLPRIKAAILSAREAERAETPPGVEWLRGCRSLPRMPSDRAADTDGAGVHPDPGRALACERHEFKRCLALRGARMEKCSSPCQSIPEQRFRPRSDDLVVLRSWKGVGR